ncbi:MAG: hypothetical protein WC791_03190 [Candidatus Paceibacterota bacterium]|jgi:hypothetical protein
MGQNILGYCIVATLILVFMTYDVVRKDPTTTVTEKLCLSGGFIVCLVAEGIGYFLVS